MPAYLVHRVAGDIVLGALEKAIPDKSPYIQGLQGGDLFFYRFHRNNKSKSMRAGYALHFRHTKAFFEQSMRFMREYAGEGKDALVSYFCGYIAHYCVDKAVHPFVFGRSHDSFSHNSLEFMLDSWYYRDMKNKDAFAFDFGSDYSKVSINPSIVFWYRKMLEEIYSIKISEKLPVRAQKDYAAQRRALQKNGPGLKIAAKFIRLFTGFEVKAFMHPRVTTEEYFTRAEYAALKETIENAAKEAAQKIGQFLSYLGGSITLQTVMQDYDNINFAGESSD